MVETRVLLIRDTRVVVDEAIPMTPEKVDRLLEGDDAWKEAEAGETAAFKAQMEGIEYGYCAITASWHWFHIGYYAGRMKAS